MPKVKLTCRVCGKEYEACQTARRKIDGVFRWQEVACSPQCGTEYLRRVSASRGLIDHSPVDSAPENTESGTKKRKRNTKGVQGAPADQAGENPTSPDVE